MSKSKRVVCPPDADLLKIWESQASGRRPTVPVDAGFRRKTPGNPATAEIRRQQFEAALRPLTVADFEAGSRSKLLRGAARVK